MDGTNKRNPRKNASYCTDLTAYEAIKNAEETERFEKLLRTIFYLCDLAGFHIEGRIVLVDKRTGRTWR